jgi:hypothetical protein
LEGPELVYGTISIVRRKFCKADSTEQRHLPDWIAVLGLLGWLLVVLGVAGEYVADALVSKADGNIQTFNDILLRDTEKDAGYARTFAHEAGNAAQHAKDESDKAGTSASNALALANDARREADTFEQDIASAKKQATEAESHLAEAMKRATALTAQLDRLTTPRSLPHSPQIIASLQPFKGTEYLFTEVCADTECIDLLKNIDNVLELSGWKRVKSPHRFPGLVLWGDPKGDDGAGIALEPGIKVSVESATPDIDKKPIANLPDYLRAAIVLNLTLASNVSPQENTGRMVGLDKGTSTVVSISVGRKPLR